MSETQGATAPPGRPLWQVPILIALAVGIALVVFVPVLALTLAAFLAIVAIGAPVLLITTLFLIAPMKVLGWDKLDWIRPFLSRSPIMWAAAAFKKVWDWTAPKKRPVTRRKSFGISGWIVWPFFALLLVAIAALVVSHIHLGHGHTVPTKHTPSPTPTPVAPNLSLNWDPIWQLLAAIGCVLAAILVIWGVCAFFGWLWRVISPWLRRHRILAAFADACRGRVAERHGRGVVRTEPQHRGEGRQRPDHPQRLG